MAQDDDNAPDPFNEDDETGFTGWTYLIDASDSRKEYAIEFEDGVSVGFHGYAPNGSAIPSGTFFALDDDQVYDSMNEEGDATILVDAFQISPVNEAASGVDFMECTVEYKKVIKPDGTYHYEMSDESIAELEEMGYSHSFPKFFKSNTSKNFVPPGHIGAKAEKIRAIVARKIREGTTEETTNGAKPSTPPSTSTAIVPVKKDEKPKISDSTLKESLEKYTIDRGLLAQKGELDPVIGREQEIKRAIKILNRRKQNSLCFTGGAGAGKTTLFDGVAQYLYDHRDDGTLPEDLAGAHVLTLDLVSMTAGSKYRGEFEERLKKITDGLAERGGKIDGKRVILAIDELPSQLSMGAAEGGGTAGEILKPMIISSGIAVLSATTDAEYERYIEKDPALARRFDKVRILAPDEKTTLEILEKLWPLTKKKNSLTEDLTQDQLLYIYRMCKRYAPQEESPAREEKVMNTAASSAQIEGRDYISDEDMLFALSDMSGLTEDFLAQNDRERIARMEEGLGKKILGQEGALKAVSERITAAYFGLRNPQQPLAAFVLPGPPGTGKTELAKVLAEYLFGDKDKLIHIDMSKYGDKHHIDNLVGTAAGHVGYEDSNPELTTQVRRNPYAVLLLDEIEKAHPDAFNVLLQTLQDGKLVDNHGRTVLFNNLIIIMTSNAGADRAIKVLNGDDIKMGIKLPGQEEASEADKLEKVREIYLDSLSAKPKEPGIKPGPLKPEVISRVESIGGIEVFNPLTSDIVKILVEREVNEVVNQRLHSPEGAGMPDVTIRLSEKAMDQLAEAGYTKKGGARELQGAVARLLSNPFSLWAIRNEEEIQGRVAKEGPVDVIIDDIENFSPRIVKGGTDMSAPSAANDDQPKPQQQPRRRGPSPGGP